MVDTNKRFATVRIQFCTQDHDSWFYAYFKQLTGMIKRIAIASSVLQCHGSWFCRCYEQLGAVKRFAIRKQCSDKITNRGSCEFVSNLLETIKRFAISKSGSAVARDHGSWFCECEQLA